MRAITTTIAGLGMVMALTASALGAPRVVDEFDVPQPFALALAVGVSPRHSAIGVKVAWLAVVRSMSSM